MQIHLSEPIIKSIFIPLLLLSLASGCGSTEKKETEKEKISFPSQTDNFEDKTGALTKTLFKPVPKVAVSAENELTDEKIRLGKLLYFDKRLSRNNDISCNSCHNLKTFGVDNLPVSPGDKGQKGARNSPTVLNAAFHNSQFWDGRASSIEEQAGMPILNPIEMAIPDKEYLIKKLSGITLYKEGFATAFPKDKQPLSYENLEKAIGAFERTLVTPSRFDEYLEGKTEVLTKEEKKGLAVFIESGCASCHSGPLLGGNMYQKFGLYGDYWTLTKSKTIDNGRFDQTKQESDKFVFKVPSLRNIEKTGPYFHDGSVANLKDAIKIMSALNLNKELTDEEIKNIEAFLKSLTGNLPEDVSVKPKELNQN